MDKYAPGTCASDLRLVEIRNHPAASSAVSGGPSPAVANAEKEGDAAGTDRFLAEAIREFQAGHVDQLLWARTVIQASGDEKLATPAYLRARATALRVAKRVERKDRSARRARALPDTDVALAGWKSHDKDTSKETSHARHAVALAKRKFLIGMTGVLASVVVVAGLIAMRSESDRAQQPNVATVARPAEESRPSMPPDNAEPAGNAGVPTSPDAPNEDFATQLQVLKNASNWNVLVLYAGEWTRKQPRNPDAWKELSVGYLKLRQFDDAFNAATKAVEIAPGDFLMWRNLGQVNLALNEPAAALLAFEQAADLNDHDVTSLVQAGTLNMQLGRHPTARIAFARALAVSPDDVDALCGAASIAQQEARVKDAESTRRQLKVSGGRCRDLSTGETASLVAGGSSKNKPVSTVGR